MQNAESSKIFEDKDLRSNDDDEAGKFLLVLARILEAFLEDNDTCFILLSQQYFVNIPPEILG